MARIAAAKPLDCLLRRPRDRDIKNSGSDIGPGGRVIALHFDSCRISDTNWGMCVKK